MCFNTSLIPRLQDVIWQSPGNETTLTHLAVCMLRRMGLLNSTSCFNNAYSMIWLSDDAPLLVVATVIINLLPSGVANASQYGFCYSVALASVEK